MGWIYRTSLYAPLISVSTSLYAAYHFRLNLSEYEVFLFLFFATWFVYLFDSIYPGKSGDEENSPERRSFVLEFQKPASAAALVSFLLSLYFFLDLSSSGKILTFIIAALSVIYLAALKKMPAGLFSAVLKPVLLASVWTLACVVFPAVNEDGFFPEYSMLQLSCSFFLLFFVNALWFDLKDRDGDVRNGKPNLFLYIPENVFVYVQWGILIAAAACSLGSPGKTAVILLSLHYTFSSWFYLQKKRRGRFQQTELFYYYWIDLPAGLVPLGYLLFKSVFFIVSLSLFPD